MTKAELLEAIKKDAKLMTELVEHCVSRAHSQLHFDESAVVLENLQNMQAAVENLRIATEQVWVGVNLLHKAPTVVESPAA